MVVKYKLKLNNKKKKWVDDIILFVVTFTIEEYGKFIILWNLKKTYLCNRKTILDKVLNRRTS